MFPISKLAAALFVLVCTLSSASATPLSGRQPSCKPNFEGNAETIYVPPQGDHANQWTPSEITVGATISLAPRTNSTTSTFLLPFSGDSSGTYQIRLAKDSYRYLFLTASTSKVYFDVVNSAPASHQLWNVNCNVCPVPGSGKTVGLAATGCTVSNPFFGTCITGDGAGKELYLSKCNWSSSQVYSFISGN